MKLISCDNCAVVLNADEIIWPDTNNHDTGCVIDANVIWESGYYVSKIDCPVCDNPVPKPD